MPEPKEIEVIICRRNHTWEYATVEIGLALWSRKDRDEIEASLKDYIETKYRDVVAWMVSWMGPDIEKR